MSEMSDLTTHSVNRMPDIEVCRYVSLWAESFGILHHQRWQM